MDMFDAMRELKVDGIGRRGPGSYEAYGTSILYARIIGSPKITIHYKDYNFKLVGYGGARETATDGGLGNCGGSSSEWEVLSIKKPAEQTADDKLTDCIEKFGCHGDAVRELVGLIREEKAA